MDGTREKETMSSLSEILGVCEKGESAGRRKSRRGTQKGGGSGRMSSLVNANENEKVQNLKIAPKFRVGTTSWLLGAGAHPVSFHLRNYDHFATPIGAALSSAGTLRLMLLAGDWYSYDK